MALLGSGIIEVGGGLDAPENVSLDVDTFGQITVSWDAVDGAEDYDVYRHTEDDFSGSSTVTTEESGTSYVDSTVTSGTTYYYWVVALDADDNESAESAVASGTASATLVSVDFSSLTDGETVGDELADWDDYDSYFFAAGGGTSACIITNGKGASSYANNDNNSAYWGPAAAPDYDDLGSHFQIVANIRLEPVGGLGDTCTQTGVAFRIDNADVTSRDYYGVYAVLDNDRYLQVRLRRFANGIGTTIDTWNDGVDHFPFVEFEMVVEVDGNDISVHIDGTERIAQTESTYAAQKGVGIICRDDKGYVQDFKLENVG